MEKKENKKIFRYFIPPIISVIIVAIIYIIKGIYPFGELTIVQGDLFQMFTPFYMRIWDFFHHGANLIYDYGLGLGR